MNKKHCVGCRNNFYNGNNNLGVEKCMLLESAKLKTRYCISSSTPTFQENFYQVKKPSCYHQTGYFYTDNIKDYSKKKKD